MKTNYKNLLLIFIGIVTFSSSFAQETTKILVKSEVPNKDELSIEKTTVAPPVISITKVSTANEIVTYAIVNDAVKNELYYNAEKRDALTALPGFVELGLSTDSTPMRVLIESRYADDYINKYFRTTTNQTTNN